MTSGITHLFNFKQNRIIIAIDPDLLDQLDIARCQAFGPKGVARTAVKGGLAGVQGRFPGLGIHKSYHKHFAAEMILDNGRDQPVQFVKIEFNGHCQLHSAPCGAEIA